MECECSLPNSQEPATGSCNVQINPFHTTKTQLFKLHGYTVHQRYQTRYCPTSAHNFKNVKLLEQFRIKEAAPTCFGLQENHHQGATAST
jgi:hypothetical protein